MVIFVTVFNNVFGLDFSVGVDIVFNIICMVRVFFYFLGFLVGSIVFGSSLVLESDLFVMF